MLQDGIRAPAAAAADGAMNPDFGYKEELRIKMHGTAHCRWDSGPTGEKGAARVSRGPSRIGQKAEKPKCGLIGKGVCEVLESPRRRMTHSTMDSRLMWQMCSSLQPLHSL